jgi:protein-S-isoprenylcysteine O-methyltransferase Ste14
MGIGRWTSKAGILGAWGVLYFARIRREEQMMLDKFGDEYRRYMSRTKRLVPFLV